MNGKLGPALFYVYEGREYFGEQLGLLVRGNFDRLGVLSILVAVTIAAPLAAYLVMRHFLMSQQ